MTPLVAVIDNNTLAALGLKQLLQQIMPIMTVDIYGSISEFQNAQPERYYHYFVSMNIVLQHRAFFSEHKRKTIVLTLSLSDTAQLKEFHSLCINQSEPQLIRQLLALVQHAHGDGRNLPPITQHPIPNTLSDREIEVMALIVQGYINKEIADRLNIGLATVVTHRKNIMEKLGIKSVSALTIYAVMHGYVDINKI